MKVTATKWPVSVTIELADDYFDGIEKIFDKEAFSESEIQPLADEMSNVFIRTKGQLLAQQEAENKQKK